MHSWFMVMLNAPFHKYFVRRFVYPNARNSFANSTTHTSDRWNWIFIHQNHTGTQFSLILFKSNQKDSSALWIENPLKFVGMTHESSKLIKIITLCIQIAFGFRYSGLFMNAHGLLWLGLALHAQMEVILVSGIRE